MAYRLLESGDELLIEDGTFRLLEELSTLFFGARAVAREPGIVRGSEPGIVRGRSGT